MDKLTVFIERMKKIGITVEMFCNYPWVYLDKVNGNKVKERFQSEHGFTIAWMPVRIGQEIKFTDIGKVFKIIRQYVQ